MFSFNKEFLFLKIQILKNPSLWIKFGRFYLKHLKEECILMAQETLESLQTNHQISHNDFTREPMSQLIETLLLESVRTQTSA